MDENAIAHVQTATVRFSDGASATFSAAEVLPGGVLKATLTDSCRPHGHEVTNVAYYSPNVWHSIQGPPTGTLMLLIGGESTSCVAANITEQQIAEHIDKWLKERVVPNGEHQKAHAMDDFNMSPRRIARFEMDWPVDGNNNTPLEHRRATRQS